MAKVGKQTYMALADTVYEVWHHLNEICFGYIVNDREIDRKIINDIVYRGWTSPKLRPHITNLLLM